jgi:hypothetical protein
MKFSILLTFFLAFALHSFAQDSVEHFKSALMPKKDGVEVVYSSDLHSLTLDVISDHIKPLDQPGYITVDKKIVQFVFIPNDALKTNDTTEATGKKLLLSYMQYELNYIKDELKLNIANVNYEWVDLNHKRYLLWYYDMPAGKKNSVLKQLNLSTICFAHALNLNNPVTEGEKFDENKALLLKVAQTLKQNDFSLDFDELYKKLNGKG